MLSRRTQIGIKTAVFLTATIGIVNLLSAVTPSLPERHIWLKEILPWEIRTTGHIFAALSQGNRISSELL